MLHLMYCKMKTYIDGAFNSFQLTIFLQNKPVFSQGMFRHDGNLQIIPAITSCNGNASFRFVPQMSEVVAMLLVFQPGFVVRIVFLQDQFILVTIRKGNVNFRNVEKGPVLAYFDGSQSIGPWLVWNIGLASRFMGNLGLAPNLPILNK